MPRASLAIAASALLMLAGCATHPAATARTGTGRRAYAYHHGHRYVVHRGPGAHDWTVVCDDDPAAPPSTPQVCRIETALQQAHPAPAAATISSSDGGRTWTVAAMPSPGAARLQVGTRPPVVADCSHPGDACTISGEDADRLTHDLQAGSHVSAQVLTTGGALDRSVSLNGFSRQLTRARALVPPDAPAPGPAAQPAASPAASPPPAAPPAPAPPASAAPAAGSAAGGTGVTDAAASAAR